MDEKELVRYLVKQITDASFGVIDMVDPEDEYGCRASAYLDVLQFIGHGELADKLEQSLF